ncbi:MAG: transposase [Patescibacteria group bacterium]
MKLVPNLPKKVQFLNQISLSVNQFLHKSDRFEGGRIGYDKEFLFNWLLIKKMMHFDYRTIGEMASVSHSTLIRANQFFLDSKVYFKIFHHLLKVAYKKGLIQGKKVSLDSSFVQTFSKKQEYGSRKWNGHKEKYGFKLHVLIDANTSFPMASAKKSKMPKKPSSKPLMELGICFVSENICRPDALTFEPLLLWLTNLMQVYESSE